MFGCVFYRGPSLLTGDPVVGIATGLDGESNNAKTGPMVQTYVLRPELAPMAAVREGLDDAICGNCSLRGRGGIERKCYVTPFMGPNQVWKMFRDGRYPDASWRDMHALVEGRDVRVCAYGDGVALPFEVWKAVLQSAASWTGYTHSWRLADARFKSLLMASVDSEREFFEAGLRGWRTFRVRMPDAPLVAGAEFICPASDEAGHTTTCAKCRLCRGTSSPARSVAIVVHGKPSSLKAFGIDVRGTFGRRRLEVLA